MSMFGTTQGAILPPKEHAPIVAGEPSAAVPGASILAQPEKTKSIAPNAQKLK